MTTATVQTPNGRLHSGRVTDWLGGGRAEVDVDGTRYAGRLVEAVVAESYHHQNAAKGSGR